MSWTAAPQKELPMANRLTRTHSGLAGPGLPRRSALSVPAPGGLILGWRAPGVSTRGRSRTRRRVCAAVSLCSPSGKLWQWLRTVSTDLPWDSATAPRGEHSYSHGRAPTFSLFCLVRPGLMVHGTEQQDKLSCNRRFGGRALNPSSSWVPCHLAGAAVATHSVSGALSPNPASRRSRVSSPERVHSARRGPAREAKLFVLPGAAPGRRWERLPGTTIGLVSGVTSFWGRSAVSQGTLSGPGR